MNLAIAFGAGILSFVSPCVLPLVPAYLVNLAGETALSGMDRRRTIAHAAAFVAGFSAVFTLLWVGIALLGTLGTDLVTWLQRIGGFILIVLGMHMLGLITIPFLERTPDCDSRARRPVTAGRSSSASRSVPAGRRASVRTWRSSSPSS